MYIHPVLVGIIATLLVEILAIVIYAASRQK